MRTVVVGAGGAIGNALVQALEKDPHVDEIHACSRTLTNSGNRVVSQIMDVTDEESVRATFKSISGRGPLDRVIVATGLLHEGERVKPEKNLSMLDPENLSRIYTINCIGPAIVAKYALPALNRKSRSVFAALSARVGSISDNRLGGWYGYRMSKAALNMFIRTAAIETRRTNPKAVVIGLHPGTVDTPLSKPFQRRVDPDRLFPPERAASQLLDVIAGARQHQSGSLLAWNGEEIKP